MGININMNCKTCNNLIQSKIAKIFCSRSCAAKFNNSKSHQYILKVSISHAPYSPKTIKAAFRPCLQGIKELVSAREARRVMLERTPFSVRLPGPAHLVQEFITNVKRSKVSINMLPEA